MPKKSKKHRGYKKGQPPNALRERNEQIYALHRDGVADTEIALRMGVSRQRVHALILEAKLDTRLDMIYRLRDTLADHVRAGYTSAEIAEMMGVTTNYVRKVTHQYGLTTNIHTIAEKQRIEEILRAAIEQGASVYSMTKGDRRMREKVYYEAHRRGIAFNTFEAKGTAHRLQQTAKRIMTGD